MSENTECSYPGCGWKVWNPNEGKEVFCIFHSPKVDEKKEEFEKKWKNFLEQHIEDGKLLQLDCSGFIFPKEISFRGAMFTQNVNFNEATFSQDVNFSNATFSQDADFSFATFSQNAHFIDAMFSQESHFNNATFLQGTYFNAANFSMFSSFNEAKFSKIANFNEAKFLMSTYFTDSTFEDNVYFNETKFSQNVFFQGTTFSKIAIFYNVTFSWIASFENAKFLDEVLFRLSQFKTIGDFKKASFIGSSLRHSSFANCSFENVKYNIKPIYRCKKPEKWWRLWTIIKQIPSTDFTGVETSDIRAASNRQFVHHIRDQQFINQFKERHRLWYYIWLISSDCGRSFFRFSSCCIIVAMLFGDIYLYEGEKWFDNACEWNILTPFYYSVVTFSTLGFGDIHPIVGSFWGEFTVMIEVMLGYIGLGGLISIFANKLARRA